GCSRKFNYTEQPIPPLQSLDSLIHVDTIYPGRLPLRQRTSVTSLAAVGDIMIGEHVIDFLNRFGNSYPFDSTGHIIRSASFAIGNLEAPFSKFGDRFDKKFTFKIDPKYADGLVSAGFDVLNLANNHILDYGSVALESTLNTLDSLNLSYCGAGMNIDDAKSPAFVSRNNIKMGFIGCSLTFPEEFWAGKHRPGTFYPREHDLLEQIKISEQEADFTVVSFHWGQELRDTPKDYQIYYAHLCIDHGADVILGHHPHILQGIELYKQKPIIYSLGNFAFGSYSGKARDSIIFKIYLMDDGFWFAKVIPLSVHNNEVKFQPKIVTGERAAAIISHLNNISFSLNQNRTVIDENGYIWGNWPETENDRN
ncbi:CapA family protein, partial [candidate division KSB1 bacterium]|nr:CapA family protein [candidate division KSB1 bacterium]